MGAEKSKKSNLQKAMKFVETFPSLNDLCAINDNSDFEENFKELYTPEIVLKKENTPNIKGQLFNLEITVKHRENLKLNYLIKKMDYVLLLLKCNIKIAICPLDFLTQQLSQGFEALQEQLLLKRIFKN